jgi:hypothetical protein
MRAIHSVGPQGNLIKLLLPGEARIRERFISGVTRSFADNLLKDIVASKNVEKP